MQLHAYLGKATHHLKNGRVMVFEPRGGVMLCESSGAVSTAEERRSRKDNPLKKLGGSDGLAARLIIGLNVGKKAIYSVDDVIKAVGGGRKGSASFIAQKGIYFSKNGERVDEESVQILIFNENESKEAFLESMSALGETLREKFHQESIILEIQERGVVKDVYSIEA